MGMGSGSSPRVRGKLHENAWFPVVVGLIPARAGKTSTITVSRAVVTAHPRACGENPDGGKYTAGQTGSSPRVRGKPGALVLDEGLRGLIPARAGKTPTSWGTKSASAAHPRACGENPSAVGFGSSALGSSPRVRGKQCGGRSWSRCIGLIPARAGKTNGRTAAARSGPAHPRACGENTGTSTCCTAAVGSSPRVRGQHGMFLSSEGARGLIPARAGKTRDCPFVRGCPRAHPRACGENFVAWGRSFAVTGSSPRVRGKRGLVRIAHGVDRLIPARAGKTGHPHRDLPRRRAHPRACGENAIDGIVSLFTGGSSPRVRGKPCGCPQRRTQLRLIPARAGKTSAPPQRMSSPWAHPRACGENPT